MKDQQKEDKLSENQVSQNESLSTQFYSPLAERNFFISSEKDKLQNENVFDISSCENGTNLLTSKTNSNSELKKIITSDAQSSWKKVEQYLNFEEDENLETNETDEFYSDIWNKTTEETQIANNSQEQTNDTLLQNQISNCGGDGELNGYLNDQKWNIDEYEDEDDYEKESLGDKKSTLKEENEYDFANSLLTLEYKPYNQFSNIDFNEIYLSSSSLSLSLNSLSISIYYSTLNRFKYQSTITDKLIQISEFNFEETLKKLLNNYSSIFPHLLYSLLKGN